LKATPKHFDVNLGHQLKSKRVLHMNVAQRFENWCEPRFSRNALNKDNTLAERGSFGPLSWSMPFEIMLCVGPA
ncbi:MAG: hypothetical protein AAF231_15365, partial [Pseudomonadota bacterium]